MPTGPLGALHFTAALAALAAGAVVLRRSKGGRAHRRWGYAYVGAMLTLNATAFGLYNLFGHWGPFHWLALASLAGVLGGVLGPLLARRRGWTRDWWLPGHYRAMGWSYIGLVAAGVAETGTRLPRAVPALAERLGATAAGLPRPTFWAVVVTCSAAVIAGGAAMLYGGQRRALAPLLRAGR